MNHWLESRRSSFVIGTAAVTAKNKVTDPVLVKMEKHWNTLKEDLTNAGAAEPNLDRYMIMLYMESGAFTNTGFKQNNPGNIMWPKSGLKYGTKGTYNAVNKTYYAAFKDLNEFAKQFMIEMNKKPGVPADATDGADFVHRLKLNKYFGDESEASYLAKLNGAKKRINLIGDFITDTDQDIVVADDKDGSGKFAWFTGLPWYGQAGLVIGAIALPVIIIKVMTD